MSELVVPRCPFCLDNLLPAEERVRCDRCSTPHHGACFRESGRCSAYGCRGALSVPSGESIYKRSQIQLTSGVEDVLSFDLLPFSLCVRPLPTQGDRRRGDYVPPEYARVEFRDDELRAGAALPGRAVLYVPQLTRYKRLELQLAQGLGSLRNVGRVALPLPGDGTLDAGSYVFELELVAPDFTSPVDPFVLTLSLVKGVLREVRSDGAVVFLLRRRLELPSHFGRMEGIDALDPGDAMVLRPGQPAPAPPPDAVVPGVHAPDSPREDLEAKGGPTQSPGTDRQIRVRPRSAPASGRVARAEAAPPPSGAPGASGDEWRGIEVQGPLRRRTLQARLTSSRVGTAEQVVIEAPSRPVAQRFPLQVAGGVGLRRLVLSLRASLVRPGGARVESSAFPDEERTLLVGESGFPLPFYELSGGVELIYELPGALRLALEEVRRQGAHNATVRLRLSVEATAHSGETLRCDDRTITINDLG